MATDEDSNEAALNGRARKFPVTGVPPTPHRGIHRCSRRGRSRWTKEKLGPPREGCSQGCVPGWKLTFGDAIAKRNAVQTDSYQDIFDAHASVVDQLHRLARPATRIRTFVDTSGTFLGDAADGSTAEVNSPVAPSEDGRGIEGGLGFQRTDVAYSKLKWYMNERTDLLDRNLALRDQVRLLESRIRSADHEVLAAQLCLKELESELCEKDLRIVELLGRLHGSRAQSGGDDPEEEASESTPLASVSIRGCKKTQPSLQTLNTSRSEGKQHPTETEALAHCRSAYQPFTSGGRPPRFKVMARPHSGAITSLAVVGSHIAVVGEQGRSVAGSDDTSTLDRTKARSLHNQQVLLSGGYDGYLTILEAHLLAVQYSFRVNSAHESAVVAVQAPLQHTEGSSLGHAVVACQDLTLCLADLDSQKTVALFRGHQARITGCGFLSLPSRTQLYLFSVGADGCIKIWDAQRSGSAAIATATCSSGITCAAQRQFNTESAASIFAASKQEKPASNTWRTAHRLLPGLLGLEMPSNIPMSTRKSATPPQEGRQTVTEGTDVLALGHQNGCASLWRIGTDAPQRISTIQPLAPLPCTTANIEAIHEGPVVNLCFAPGNSDAVYTVGLDGRLVKASVDRGLALMEFEPVSFFRPSAHARVCSPTPQIVIGAASTSIACWDARTGHCVSGWEAPAPVTSLAWAGGSVVSGHGDGTVLLWERHSFFDDI